MSWLSRLGNVFRSERLHRELDDELMFHIEERTDELVRQGIPRPDAISQARKSFGCRLKFHESSRDVKVFTWLESMLQDVRFGLRVLWKDRTVSAAAVLSLSLAIGSCTAAFSLIDALILRPLPVHRPESLVYLVYPNYRGGPDETSFSYPFFQRLQESSRRQVELFGVSSGGGLTPVVFENSGEEAEKVRAQAISGKGFSILGVKPALGRMLTAKDDAPEAENAAAIISHNFWTRRFGADPSVIGRWLKWDGKQFQIVGVTQKGFSGLDPGYSTDLWVSIMARTRPATLVDAGGNWGRVWGRVQSGVSTEQARQVLHAAFSNFRHEIAKTQFPKGSMPDRLAVYLGTPLHLQSAKRGGDSLFRWQFGRPLWILGAVAVLLLLIACSNVANLFVARAAAREREMAMRIAIGAGRLRLIQQVIIESSLIAGLACVLGLTFASAMTPGIVSLLAPADFPIYLDIQPDWRMLSFVAVIGILTTLLFGTAPALRASVLSPDVALKSGSAKQSSRIRMIRALLTLQVGFSTAVLLVAGLFILSFQRLTSVDLGFARNGIVLLTVDAKDLKDSEKARVTGLQLLDRIRQLPSVQQASLSGSALLGGPYAWVMTSAIQISGRPLERPGPNFLEVSPGFFDTMRIRLLEGRDIAPADTEPEFPAAVIVNRAFAERYFPGESPIGKQFHRKAGEEGRLVPQQIVGMVTNAKYNNIREEVKPTIYGPARAIGGQTLEVRTAGDPGALIQILRKEIESVHPALHVTNAALQSTRIENTLLGERLLALLSVFFAFVALVIAAVGFYGVISYSSIRRTKEIGIRIALGARRSGVVRLVLSEVLLVTMIGLAAGAASGLALSRLVTSVLFEVKPTDFWSIALPVVCLFLANALAALPPVLRAARVDPMVALRYE